MMTWTIWLIPIVVSAILIVGLMKKVPVYDQFIDGASDGLKLVLQLFPHLLAMLVAVQIVRTTGLLDLLMQPFAGLAEWWKIPSDVLPLMPLRSISGTGALAYANELMRTYGVDSIAGRIAAIVQGSSETTLYVITVYLGAVGVRSSAKALGIGLFADVIGFLAAVMIVLWLSS